MVNSILASSGGGALLLAHSTLGSFLFPWVWVCSIVVKWSSKAEGKINLAVAVLGCAFKLVQVEVWSLKVSLI